ncbi:hypothetical protein GE107_09570 [Cohnella sp. CFH 77786]|uniref:hypothetical protein n=1 Tax=Cohnella sp. CFH 77786 TaxID=2662265 RepID=UPI001C60A565|nr:hypothetical protein [Cohnella sp. CFH 77786]MBW5446307.1 hypothetical protein [Cohnella sp. CFH 77786]
MPRKTDFVRLPFGECRTEKRKALAGRGAAGLNSLKTNGWCRVPDQKQRWQRKQPPQRKQRAHPAHPAHAAHPAHPAQGAQGAHGAHGAQGAHRKPQKPAQKPTPKPMHKPMQSRSPATAWPCASEGTTGPAWYADTSRF